MPTIDLGKVTADPPTTEEMVAGLVDANIEVASIGLTDGTGTALAAGSLSLNAAGKVVVHDNDSNAEDLPHLVNSLESINFATRVLAASMDNATFSRKLADIPLPASALTDGKQLHLIGRIFGIWTTGNKPDAGAFIVLCKEGQDPKIGGVYMNFAEGTVSEQRDFHIPLSFAVTLTTWTLTKQGGAAPAAIAEFNNGGTVTSAPAWITGTDYATEAITGTVGDPIKLEIHILTFDTSDVVTASLFASGQLSAISE